MFPAKKLALIFLSLLIYPSHPLHAQVQAIFEDFLAPDIKVTWLVVGDFPNQNEKALSAFQTALGTARNVLEKIDPQNPFSEISQLMAKKEKGTYEVSLEVAQILNIAKEVSDTLKEPMAKKIRVDLAKPEVALKSTDVEINIEPLLKGFLADRIMQQLLDAGWNDSYIDLDGIFITRGEDFNGKWKIPVIDPTNAKARHAFFYKATDIAAATVSYDPKSLRVISPDLRSVTIFSKDGACKAQGLASAMYTVGLESALKLLKRSDISRAVLIDQNGQFIQFPEQDGKSSL